MHSITSYFALMVAALAVTGTAAPTANENVQLTRRYEGEAHFQSNWDEGGRKRYRYTFTGTSCDKFNAAIAGRGGLPGPAGMNFQCWGENPSTFDCSVVAGVAGADIISKGVGDVTGQSCEASGFCP
ncbi:hypothetical protein BS50DRAFT_675225 [Corynespora cassiicola Philippines]|uniref:Uncharacterized protein n=1 Tax=Corynespora cassiicola Philippines TaxID=1448308 RepID=A0A2T2NU68_CORCC|nr:hypothetical protein BS50DRAFT_675225 [Corynespora cassiicola Philippines]